MTVFVLDSSAVLRYLDKEAGGDRVREIILACAGESASMNLSAVQWGEIASTWRKRYGSQEQDRILAGLMNLNLGIVPTSADRAVRAAAIRIDRKLGYAEAFAVDLALDSPEHVLVTADYDFKAVEDLIQIEFLPVK